MVPWSMKDSSKSREKVDIRNKYEVLILYSIL